MAALLEEDTEGKHHVPMAVHAHTSQMRGLWTLGASEKSHQVL